ncbi:MAG TPA: PocR ligand-binding domain-containing protein, partial [Polyangiaceae bacterium]|nr:PocR ligand-binding domain-containing protein [Polyangiaceae bacterium]
MTVSAAPPKTLDELTLGGNMGLEDLLNRDGLAEMVKSAGDLFDLPIRVFTEEGKLLADAADSIELYAYLNTSRAGRAALSDVVAAVKALAPGPDGEAHYTCITGATYRVAAIVYDARQIGRMILGPYTPDPDAEPPAKLLAIDPQLDAGN